MDYSKNFGGYGPHRVTIRKDQIMDFLADLRSQQEAMIEELVARKEQQGFPEVVAILQQFRA